MTEAEKDLIQGQTGTWEVVVGMEVHAQVISDSKLFSSAATAFGASPNSQVSLVDAGMPGMLPVLNEVCVAQAVRTGLGLKAKINRRSIFDRKNYFYPDLPQGYQISQFSDPIVGEGNLQIELADGRVRDIGIERIHLEQDAGKSLHDQDPDRSFVDLNRSGVGLMEIVSKPDMRSAEQAGAYMRKLRAILRYLGTCDGNMEEGSLRADVNVSVRRPGAALGTRTETKNVNSIRFIQQVVAHEAARQVEILEAGGAIDQETLLFDADTGETRSMRSKEDAHDYRYFPCPDLLPLQLDDAFIAAIEADLPELPDAKKARFVSTLGLNVEDAGILVENRAMADYFEQVADGRDAKIAANWVIGALMGQLNRLDKDFEENTVSADGLGALLDLIEADTISARSGKDVLAEMLSSGKEAALIVAEKGLQQVSDSDALSAMVDALMAENPDKVADIRAGKNKIIGWFVGQVMQQTKGKANPKIVNELLAQKLRS